MYVSGAGEGDVRDRLGSLGVPGFVTWGNRCSRSDKLNSMVSRLVEADDDCSIVLFKREAGKFLITSLSSSFVGYGSGILNSAFLAALLALRILSGSESGNKLSLECRVALRGGCCTSLSILN